MQPIASQVFYHSRTISTSTGFQVLGDSAVKFPGRVDRILVDRTSAVSTAAIQVYDGSSTNGTLKASVLPSVPSMEVGIWCSNGIYIVKGAGAGRVSVVYTPGVADTL